jgi:hypothetical protein
MRGREEFRFDMVDASAAGCDRSALAPNLRLNRITRVVVVRPCILHRLGYGTTSNKPRSTSRLLRHHAEPHPRQLVGKRGRVVMCTICQTHHTPPLRARSGSHLGHSPLCRTQSSTRPSRHRGAHASRSRSGPPRDNVAPHDRPRTAAHHPVPSGQCPIPLRNGSALSVSEVGSPARLRRC